VAINFILVDLATLIPHIFVLNSCSSVLNVGVCCNDSGPNVVALAEFLALY